LYIRNIILDDMGIPLLRCLALSGRLDATFHGVVNFAITEFSEVPRLLYSRTMVTGQ
jgi:hypothetical protein